jgi:hypothetical protein
MEADRSVETPWAIATPVAAAYENARALTAEAVGDDLRDEMSAIFPTALSGKEESGAAGPASRLVAQAQTLMAQLAGWIDGVIEAATAQHRLQVEADLPSLASPPREIEPSPRRYANGASGHCRRQRSPDATVKGRSRVQGASPTTAGRPRLGPVDTRTASTGVELIGCQSSPRPSATTCQSSSTATASTSSAPPSASRQVARQRRDATRCGPSLGMRPTIGG